MHFDIDLHSAFEDKDLRRLAQTVQASTSQYFPGSERQAEAVVCCSTREGLRISSSLHVIFPRLPVTEGMALWIRAGVVAACFHALPGVDFNVAIDISTLTTSGLRLLGSDKCRICTGCRNGRDARMFCAECNRRGRVAENKIYMPWFVVPENVELQEQVLANIAFASKLCSIRLDPSVTASRFFQVPAGSPPANLKKRLRADGDRTFQLHEPASAVPPNVSKMALLDAEPALLELIRRDVRGYHSAYSQLDIREVRESKGSKCPLYIVKVRGFGSRFCLNKGAEHTSQSIYIVITGTGMLQRCYSRKDTHRLYGKCEQFRSPIKALSEELRAALFDGQVVFPQNPSIQRPRYIGESIWLQSPQLPDITDPSALRDRQT
jgi:hypothetical protein